MSFKNLKVYHYFWIVSLVLLLTGLLQNNKDAVFDINIDDTYYVIPYVYTFILFSIAYCLLGVGYWFALNVLQKPLIQFLTVIHCIVMFGWFLVYGIVYCYTNFFMQDRFPLFDNYQYLNQTIVFIILVVTFVAQPAYLINLFVAICSAKVSNIS